jgi:hypothetical protein
MLTRTAPIRVSIVAALPAVLLAALLVTAEPASAAAADLGGACSFFAPHPGVIDGVLVPGVLPAADPAIVAGDPDAEAYPMEPVRFPEETGLWAETGTNGALLANAAADEPPVGGSAELDVTRTDRAVSDSIVRLYLGLFSRQPASEEVDYWARRYWNGLPLSSIAESFTRSAEFVGRYGDPTDEALVTLLYENVLCREPGEGGVEPFYELLRSGELNRGSLIVSFTDSSEFVAQTATASPEKPPLPYPAVGSGRRIIYANREARVWFVEATGELVKTHQVSGRRGVPTPGRYNVYSKSRYAWAPSDGITMEYMVRFAREEWPYGFHSIPIWPDKEPLQTKEQLGTLRSGGCVRQDFDDAAFTFGWADVGTRVVMIP